MVFTWVEQTSLQRCPVVITYVPWPDDVLQLINAALAVAVGVKEYETLQVQTVPVSKVFPEHRQNDVIAHYGKRERPTLGLSGFGRPPPDIRTSHQKTRNSTCSSPLSPANAPVDSVPRLRPAIPPRVLYP